jgi:shikimate dehydrogenase
MPSEMTVAEHGSDKLRVAVQHCCDEAGLAAVAQPAPPAGVTIAGIGTTAQRALQGSLLRDALAAAHVDLARTQAFADPAGLAAHADWNLALVLSPWKQKIADCADAVTRSAEITGVIDTLVRHRAGTLGINTNCWAAQAAMEIVMGGTTPTVVLILGSGGSSNSIALAAQRAWPGVRLVGSARNPSALADWASSFGASAVAPTDLTAYLDGSPPHLIVNTTTWGETDESESDQLAFPFHDLTSPGNRFFDLNNRISALQTHALKAGMSVMAGTFMQRVTNACRAALLAEVTS